MPTPLPAPTRRFAPRTALAAFALAFLALLLCAPPAHAIRIERVVSPGGIEAWLVPDPKVPVLSMEFSFEGGMATDPEGKEGLANLASTLLDEGAGPYDSRAFQQRLSDNSISLGFTAGADAFFGSFKTLTETRDEAVDLLRLALTQPRFEQDAVERMRSAVLSGIRRSLGDPDYLSRAAFYDAAYPGHPYGRRSKGTLDSVPRITVEDLRGFAQTRFARGNLTVGVSGDITAEELGPLLDRVFGELPAEASMPDIPDRAPQTAGETLVVPRPIGQSIVLMGQPGIARDDPDWFAATIMNYVLGGGGFGSRLMEEIREKRGLSYGVYSYLLPFEHSALAAAGGSTANANAGTMIELMKGEWSRMREEGVTEEELADAKTYLTGSFPLQFTSTEAIAGILLQVQRDELGIDYLDRRDALIEGVTIGDVNRVAKELLAPEKLLTVVVGQPEGVEATRIVEEAGG
jgi:zinc protease